MTSPSAFLKDRSIRNTASREAVLAEFLSQDQALSQPDLEKALGAKIDRVTIYRTLSLFLDKSILHKVLDDSGSTKYALCPDTCDEEGHEHEHVHFQCEKCGQTSCLDEVHVPRINLPAGYVRKEVNFLITGICKNCA